MCPLSVGFVRDADRDAFAGFPPPPCKEAGAVPQTVPQSRLPSESSGATKEKGCVCGWRERAPGVGLGTSLRARVAVVLVGWASAVPAAPVPGRSGCEQREAASPGLRAPRKAQVSCSHPSGLLASPLSVGCPLLWVCR